MIWCLQPNLLETIEFSEFESGKYTVTNQLSGLTKQAYPEEIVRQLMFSHLVSHYNFSQENIAIEYPIQMGITKKRADIVVLAENKQPLIIIEVKVKINSSSKEQLFSYLQATSARLGVLVDSNKKLFFQKDNAGQILEVDGLDIKDTKKPFKSVNNNINYFGITGLIKEVYPDGAVKWLVDIKNKQFEVSLKDLQDFSKIQTGALEVGESLLNYNPSRNEWKSNLHVLITTAKVENKEEKIKDCEEYYFFSDLAIMFRENDRNIRKHFSIKRDRTLVLWFNGIYSEYCNYKSKKKEKPISKKSIILFLQRHKLLIERSKSCRIHDKTVRAMVVDISKLPRDFKYFLSEGLNEEI